MLRKYPRGRLIAAACALSMLAGGAVALADAPPAAAASGPSISDPGFDHQSWDNTLHYHASFVSPGADGTGFAVRIGLGFEGDSTTPVDGNLPVRGEMPARGMVNKIVSDVKPNTRYAFSVMVKGPNVQAGIFDVEHSQYYKGYAGQMSASQGRYSTTEWTKATGTITTGPRTTELNAFCLTYASDGPNYCDDFSLTEIAPVPEPPAPAPKLQGAPPATHAGFPATIPAVQQFTPADPSGSWTIGAGISRIVVDAAHAKELEADARLLAEDLNQAYGWEVAVSQGTASAAPDELFYTIGQVDLGEAGSGAAALVSQASRIDISPEGIAITGGGAAGAFYAGQTLVQALQGQTALPAGTVLDYTDQEIRGLQVDSARRYYSIDWLKNQIDDMAYTKLNYLLLRVKDSQGLRVESDVAPGLVDHLPDGGSWSKAEVADLVAYARARHVTVIPEVDMPGHAIMDSIVYPDMMFSTSAGEGDIGYDYTKPEVREFLAALAVEVGETFDSPYVHLGGDEYFPSTNKHFVDWIRTLYPTANSDDAYAYLFNQVHTALQEHGRGAWMFNDMVTSANGAVPIEKDITIVYWAKIYNSMRAQAMIDAGYQLVGSSSDLYHDLWPATSIGATNNSINQPLPEYQWKTYASPFVYSGGFGPPSAVTTTSGSRGQFFPIWDDAMGWAPEYVLTQTLMPRLRVHAQTLWNSPRPSSSYADFDRYVQFFGHAPGFTQPTTSVGLYTLHLDLGAAEVAQGSQVEARATGFLPGETVTFTADGASPVALGSATADAQGEVTVSLTVPRDGIALGEASVLARGETSHRPTTAALTITQPAPEPDPEPEPEPEPDPVPPAGTQGLYRFYKADGTHFYTASEFEANLVKQSVDYTYEGVTGFILPENSAAEGTTALHRFYKVDGTHFYTADAYEASEVKSYPQYTYEGVVGRVYTDGGDGLAGMHRFYKTGAGTHFYTADAYEAQLVKGYPEYRYENVAFYLTPAR